MSSQEGIKKPKLDDKPLWNVIAGLVGYHAVTVAHHLDLFSLLEKESKTIEEISKLLKIDTRPTEALLLMNMHLGFLTTQNERFGLSEHAKEYLLKTSPTYFGGMLDLAINNGLTFEKLREAVLTNRPQVYGGGDIFESHEKQIELAMYFTEAMHSISMAPASGWVDKVNLAQHQVFLDIGGGSGAHTIGALSEWDQLTGIILDIAPVCNVCMQMLTKYGFSSRASTFDGDFWKCDYPQADVHFYSQIYHDWPEEKCKFLTEKSFQALPSGGKLLIHEMLFNDDKQGPFAAAAGSVAMLSWTEGKHYSGKELSDMLMDAGFANIQVMPTFGYWSLVAGEKA